MVLDKLGSALRESLRKIARSGYIDKETLEITVKDIQRALLASDVNVKLVFEMSESIKKRALEEKPKTGLSKREHVVNIVHEELLKALAGEEGELKLEEKGKIMLVGLFGAGKTTTCAKLGKYLQKKGLKVAMISTDTWRPAAYEQLKQLVEENNIPVFGGGKDPIKILKENEANVKDADIVIVDSAGRDALTQDAKGRNTIDKELTKELKHINDTFKPQEKILIMPADVGQKAAEQARAFNETVGVTGVILTKLDSSAKGGGALSACATIGVPIKFVGVGEGINALEEFNPTKFISKLLGMGDLETLIKKTAEVFDEEDQDKMKEMAKGKFTLKDLYKQIQGMKKMGSMSKIMEMLPMGVDLPKDQMQMSEERIKKFTTIMDSMTKEELNNPEVLSGARVKRIAKGAGVSVEDVRMLLKQYNMTKKMMKQVSGNKRGMGKMMRMLKGKIPGM
ncbi:MAG: signal recognition particle receptor subunit alpha [Candidatus Undinarchaeales archaeon]|nr:signal recognition particle receptor subunit alpha [Candidatus Undinarchaeales archaeon]